MANWYYYGKTGEKVGPVSATSLKELARQGLITPETKVENQNGRTAVAGQINGLTFTETKPPETPVYGFDNGFNFPELTSEGQTPTDFDPFVNAAPVSPQVLPPTKSPSAFTKPVVLVPISVGIGMLLMLPLVFMSGGNQGQIANENKTQAAQAIDKEPTQVTHTLVKKSRVNPDPAPPVKVNLTLHEPQKQGGSVMFTDMSDKVYSLADTTFATFSAWNNSTRPLLHKMSDVQECCDGGMDIVLEYWARCLSLGTSSASRSVFVPDKAVGYVLLCFQTGNYNTNIEQAMSSIRGDVKKLDKNKYVNTIKLYGILSLHEQSVKSVSGEYNEYQKKQKSLKEEFTQTKTLAELEW